MGANRVLIADRHELVRLGVRAIVEGEADMQLVAELDDARDAIAEAKRRSVDVALLGVDARSMDGHRCLPQDKRRVAARKGVNADLAQ